MTARAATIASGEKKPLAELCTRRTADGKFESPRLNAPKLPQFVVPTTPSTAFVKAGTAVHGEDGERFAMFDPKTRAKAIFVHPDFVMTSPLQLVHSATLNAFANAVEALESPKCDPFSEALLMQALRLIRANLHRVGSGGVGAENYSWSPRFCAVAERSKAGQRLRRCWRTRSAIEGTSQTGSSNAIVLPHTMRYNAPATLERGATVVEALLDRGGSDNGEAVASSVVEKFLNRLAVPRSLREIGVKRDDLSEIADAAMLDWFISRNPKPVSDSAALREVLGAAW